MSFEEYIKTKPGKFRLATIGVGFFAVVFGSAGHDYQNLINFSGGSAWKAKLSLAIIIIAWLFSIIMFLCAATPSMGRNVMVNMADHYGHISLGVALILSFLLCLWYIFDFIDGFHCFSRNATSDCLGYVFFSPWKNILWLLAGIFALAHGILCIMIFMMLRNAQGRIAPLMVNQTGSEAPPGSYPSQAGSQQQAPPPEQEPSGHHHSKHSHKK